MDCFSLSTEIRKSVTFWDSQLATIIRRVLSSSTCIVSVLCGLSPWPVAHCPETGAEHTDIQDVEG